MAVQTDIDVAGRRPAAVPRSEPVRGADVSVPNLRLRLLAGDAVAAAVAFFPLVYFEHSPQPGRVAVASAAGVLSLLLVTRFVGLYRSCVCATLARQLIRVVVAVTIACAVFSAVESVLQVPSSWPALAKSGVVALVLILGFRWWFSRWLKEQRAAGRFLRTVVMVGTNRDAIAVSDMLFDEPELGYRVGAVVGKGSDDPHWSGLPRSPNVEDLVLLARQVRAAGVMIVDAELPARDAAVAVQAALDAGLHVQLWPALPGVISRRVRSAPVSGLPVFYVEPARPALWQLAVKRIMDVVVAAFLLPLSAPVLLAAAIAIRLEDGGPVLYHHAVIGRHGRPIEVLKLRTMVPNASERLYEVESLNERRGGPLFKASNDPRVTRVGRFLRATSIDELPQLWNVMTGRMSLVGPRFSLPDEAAQFDDEHRRRTLMRPGMTGLWQTEARDNPSFSAYRRLDLLYVDNWSLGLDVSILTNTAYAVMVRAGRAILARSDRPAPQASEACDVTGSASGS